MIVGSRRIQSHDVVAEIAIVLIGTDNRPKIGLKDEARSRSSESDASAGRELRSVTCHLSGLHSPSLPGIGHARRNVSHSSPRSRTAARTVPSLRSFRPQSGNTVAPPLAGWCHF